MSKSAGQSDAANEDVRIYMLEQNRPYSVIDVHTNLRGKYGKAVIVRALEQLVDSGTLTEKVVGKQKMFFPNQDQFPAVDETQMKELDAKVASGTNHLDGLKTKHRSLEAGIKCLGSALTTEQLMQQVSQLQAELTSNTHKLQQLQSAGNVVDPQAKKMLQDKQLAAVSTCNKRKRMANEMLNTVLENCPKKKKDLVEEMGLELD